MFADPQSVTISGTTYSLPRIGTGPNASNYASSALEVQEVANHVLGKRARRQIRMRFSKIAVDPLIPTQNSPYSMSTWLGFDVPLVGFTIAEQKAAADGFLAQLQATSGLLITQLLGGQS